jgi:hypothetical protein
MARSSGHVGTSKGERMRITARHATRGILIVLVAIGSVIATTGVTQAATPSGSNVGGSSSSAPSVRTPVGNGPAQTFTNADINQLVPGAGNVLTHDNIVEALTSLEAAVPHQAAAGRADAYTYTIDGNSLTLPTAAAFAANTDTTLTPAKTSGGLSPNFAYCECGGREIITLNQQDQIALKNGGAAAFVAAVCLIPVVGWVACAVISVVAAVAATYLITHGICSGGRNLYVWNANGGSVVQCRSSRP